METLIYFLLGAAGVWYWYNATEARTHAIGWARRECEKHGVQLLDQSVHRIKISMSRDGGDTWRIWREYRFEYSDNGVDRYEGRLVMLGYRPVRSVLETSDPVIH